MPFLTHNHLRLTRRTIQLSRLPKAFEGFKIVQLSDLHIYEYTEPAYYEQVIRLVNELSPEIVVLTGDTVHFGKAYIPMAASFLRQISARHGKFAIIGNHDFHDEANGDNIGKMLQDCGYQFLRNKSAFIEYQQERLWFVGLDDLWYGIPDIEQGLQAVPLDQAVIMLAHNPIMFDPIAYNFGERVDLVLSGHTHAGHVYIPILGPIYRKIFRMKYRYGLFRKNNCQLHVTSGVGSAAFYLKKLRIGFPRFRFNTHPEIAVLTLTSQAQAEQ